jgi:hypothetical protein
LDIDPHRQQPQFDAAVKPLRVDRGFSRVVGSRRFFQLALAILAVGLGCGEGTAPPPPVSAVVVSPSPATFDLVVGGTGMFTVVTKDAKGTALVDRTVTWTTSDPAKATVAAGLVTGVGLGTATITASSEGVSATVDVKIKEGAVCGTSGCSFTGSQGAIAVSVPAGAVTQTTNLTVEPASNAPANPRVLPGTAFNFGPGGAAFPTPPGNTIKYEPATVASDSQESGLVV